MHFAEEFENIPMCSYADISQSPVVDTHEAHPGQKKGRRNKSAVWDFFEEDVAQRRAVCLLCNKSYSKYPSTMREHLVRNHPEEWNQRINAGLEDGGELPAAESPAMAAQSHEILESFMYVTEPMFVQQTDELPQNFYGDVKQEELGDRNESELDRIMMNVIQEAQEYEHSPVCSTLELPPSPVVTVPTPGGSKQNRKNKSAVWDFFDDDIAGRRATCILCKRVYSRYPSTLKDHLERTHKEEWSRRVVTDASGAAVTSSSPVVAFAESSLVSVKEESIESGENEQDRNRSAKDIQEHPHDSFQSLSAIITSKRVRKRKSTVWDFFEDDIVERRAICMLCSRSYSTYPSTLRDHLERSHPEEWKKRRVDDGAAPSDSPRRTPPSISKEPFEALINLFACTTTPTTLVEKPEFQRFVATLDPAFHVPSVDTIQEALLQQYNELKTKIGGEMRKSGGVSLSVQLWSREESKKKSFLAITAHFVCKEKQKVLSLLLDVDVIGNDSSEGIKDAVARVINDYGMQITDVEGVVIGNYETNEESTLWRISDISHPYGMPCFVRSLESVLERAVKEYDTKGRIQKIYADVGRLEGKSANGNARRNTIFVPLLELDAHQTDLEEEDFASARKIRKALGPFEKFVQLMERQTDVTISNVLPFLKDQLITLENTGERFESVLASHLRSHFKIGESEFERHYLLAAYLDPNFFFTLTTEEISQAEELLLSRIITGFDTEGGSVTQLNNGDTTPQDDENDDLKDVPEFCRNLYAAKRNSTHKKRSSPLEDLAHSEIRKYREAQQNSEYSRTDTIRFWTNNAKVYPLIHRLALRLLALPASSSSEKSFSLMNFLSGNSGSIADIETIRTRTLLSVNKSAFAE